MRRVVGAVVWITVVAMLGLGSAASAAPNPVAWDAAMGPVTVSPNPVACGQKFLVSFTAQNTGDAMWSERHVAPHAELPSQNFAQGSYAQGSFADGTLVAAGSSEQMIVELTAPETPGTYGVTVQMYDNASSEGLSGKVHSGFFGQQGFGLVTVACGPLAIYSGPVTLGTNPTLGFAYSGTVTLSQGTGPSSASMSIGVSSVTASNPCPCVVDVGWSNGSTSTGTSATGTQSSTGLDVKVTLSGGSTFAGETMDSEINHVVDGALNDTVTVG